jgi:hypothetical protein
VLALVKVRREPVVWMVPLPAISKGWHGFSQGRMEDFKARNRYLALLRDAMRSCFWT